MTSRRFEDKTAILTGGAKGIGKATALRYLSEGGRLAVVDQEAPDSAFATALRSEAGQSAQRLAYIQADVTDETEVARAVGEAEAALGPADILVNNVGFGANPTPIETLSMAEWEQFMSINLTTAFLLSRAVGKNMLARGSGDFVSFSSMSGIIPGLLMGGYCATKSAVQAYTEILYHENLDKGVRFVCVCPPPVATPLWKQAEDTVVPKLTAESEAIEPEEVIDTLEASLEKGDFLSFPGKQTKMGYIMRRLFPGYIWKLNHKVEGF